MHRSTILLLLLLLISSSFLYSQRNKLPDGTFYVFDENWKGTTIEKAVYLAREIKINDTCYKWDSYNFTGPLVKSETFKDDKATIPHGKFAFYDSKGNADSIGYYSNGLANGTWYIMNDTGKVIIEKKYDLGKLISVRDILKEDSANAKNDDKDAKEEKESEFPGSLGAWQRYLNHNLRYPDRALNMNKEGQVTIIFIVTEDGKIDDPTLLQSVEFSLDEEAMRIIKNSPKWVPAVKSGKKIKSYKKQPIVFRTS